MNIDKTILAKAASELRDDVGSLRDLPLKLRDTIASLYYEYWWIQLSLEPSAGHSSWTDHMVTRMGLYGMVPELVTSMREIRKENQSFFEMTIGTTLDLLRYNLKDVTRKSAARRAMEKAIRKPFFEIPGIYALTEQAWSDTMGKVRSAIGESDSVDLASTDPDGAGERENPPNLTFAGTMPDSDFCKPVKFKFRDVVIDYYENPRTLGETVGIRPIFEYPQFAVVRAPNTTDPRRLVVRVEASGIGVPMLCSLDRSGNHKVHGEWSTTDRDRFVRKVAEIASISLSRQRPHGADENTQRAIVECPSCRKSLRVPKFRSGRIRCPLCQHLFEADTS